MFWPKSYLEVNNKKLNIYIADSPDEWERGLSWKDNMPENRGMLFIFSTSDFYKIWMKDMKFPIDIIWIGEDKKIVDIKTNISPQTFPEIFTSRQPARYVLEVNSGWVDENKIEIEDKIWYNLGLW